jgi:hypothetical protein
VRNFVRSTGRLAKNDTIDAQMIAWFAEIFGPATTQAHDADREKLVQIVHARQALIDVQSELQNRGGHSVPDVVERVARLLKKIVAELATLEAAMVALVKATPRFAELAEIIESVPGLAEITSASADVLDRNSQPSLVGQIRVMFLREVLQSSEKQPKQIGMSLPMMVRKRAVSVFLAIAMLSFIANSFMRQSITPERR